MKLAIKTCTLDMPYEQMLDFCVEQKIAAIEIGTGNWSEKDVRARADARRQENRHDERPAGRMQGR